MCNIKKILRKLNKWSSLSLPLSLSSLLCLAPAETGNNSAFSCDTALNVTSLRSSRLIVPGISFVAVSLLTE